MSVFTFYFSRQMTFIISTLFNIRPTFIFCGRFICRKKQRRGLQDSGLAGLGRLITVLHCLYTEWTSSTVPQDTNQILSVANTQRRVLNNLWLFSHRTYLQLWNGRTLCHWDSNPILQWKPCPTWHQPPPLKKGNLHIFHYVYFSQQGAQMKEKRICCRLCPLQQKNYYAVLWPPPPPPS